MTSRYTSHRTAHAGVDLRNLPQPQPPVPDDDEFSDFKSGLLPSSGTGSGVSLTPLPLLSKNLLQFNFSPVHQSNKEIQNKGTGPGNSDQQREVGNRLANYNGGLKSEGRGEESSLIGDEDKYSPLRSFLQNEFKQTLESHDEVARGCEADFGDFQGFTSWDSKEDHLSVSLSEVPLSAPYFTAITLPQIPIPVQVPVPPVNNPFLIESQPPSSSSLDDFGDFVSCSKVLPNPSIPSPVAGRFGSEKTTDLADLFGLGISRNSNSNNMGRRDHGILVDSVPLSTDRRGSGGIGRLPAAPPARPFPFDGVPPLKTTLITGPTTSTDTDDPFGDFLVGSSPVVAVKKIGEGTLSTTIPKNENSPETLSVSSLDLGNYASTWEVPDSLTGNLQSTLKEIPKASKDSTENKDKYNPFKQEQEREIQKCVKEWRRALETCLRLLEEGERLFHSVSSSDVLRDVIQVEKGRTYVLSLRQIYLLACRVYQSWMRLDGTEVLGELHQKLALAWDSIAPFLVGTNLEEDVHRRSPISEDDPENVCGICLVGTGWRDGAEEESWRLSLDFGGTLYHLPCANFWINQLDSLLPSLTSARKTINQIQQPLI